MNQIIRIFRDLEYMTYAEAYPQSDADKALEDAAEVHANSSYEKEGKQGQHLTDGELWDYKKEDFIAGVKSHEAKAYHTKGANEYLDSEGIKQSDSIVERIREMQFNYLKQIADLLLKLDLTKGMYTEEELKKLMYWTAKMTLGMWHSKKSEAEICDEIDLKIQSLKKD
jgi:hypothetical protein